MSRSAIWWQILLGLAAGIVLLYLVLLALLWQARRRNPDTARMREALRLLPDVLRLLRRLAADRDLPRGVRIRLILLIAYLASPIDLIPDFIPKRTGPALLKDCSSSNDSAEHPPADAEPLPLRRAPRSQRGLPMIGIPS